MQYCAIVIFFSFNTLQLTEAWMHLRKVRIDSTIAAFPYTMNTLKTSLYNCSAFFYYMRSIFLLLFCV